MAFAVGVEAGTGIELRPSPFACLDTLHPFALSLSKGRHTPARGFDKLSPNGGRGAHRSGGTGHCLPPDTDTPNPPAPDTPHPFAPDTPHPFALSLSKGRYTAARGFDKLSPNGRRGAHRSGGTGHCLPPDTDTPNPPAPDTPHPFALSTPHPFALSLSKGRHTAARGFDKLSPNGRRGAYRSGGTGHCLAPDTDTPHPFALSLSKGRP